MKNLFSSEKTDAEILRARAIELAREPEAPKSPDSFIEVIAFHTAGESYGIQSKYVREVYRFDDLTPLPGTPSFIAGIVNVRGRILPVVDLQQFFNLPQQGITDTHIVLVILTQEMEVGFLADNIIGLRTLDRDEIQEALPTFTKINNDYLIGVAARELVIIDALAILSSPAILVDQHVDL